MNLYILTEERPKISTLKFIIERFLQDKKFSAFIDSIRILPIVENGRFLFCYEIIGVRCNQIDKIYLKITSGGSSFVDYLVFFQSTQPMPKDSPLYAIEETKTSDKESRNTGALQRIAKFVYVDYFYPNAIKIMFYNLEVLQKQKPTDTNIFGTRILRTLVLFGSDNEQVIEIEVGFLLNNQGKMILGIKAPQIFITALKNLLDFWGKK